MTDFSGHDLERDITGSMTFFSGVQVPSCTILIRLELARLRTICDGHCHIYYHDISPDPHYVRLITPSSSPSGLLRAWAAGCTCWGCLRSRYYSGFLSDGENREYNAALTHDSVVRLESLTVDESVVWAFVKVKMRNKKRKTYSSATHLYSNESGSVTSDSMVVSCRSPAEQYI